MTLKLVKDGPVESSPDIVQSMRDAIVEAEANELFSIALVKLYNDPEREPEMVISGNDSLITCTTAEEVSRMGKLQILGLI